MQHVRMSSGALPSQGRVTPAASGGAALRYPSYNRQARAMRNNMSTPSIRYQNPYAQTTPKRSAAMTRNVPRGNNARLTPYRAKSPGGVPRSVRYGSQ